MKKSITILCILTAFFSCIFLHALETVTLIIQPDPRLDLLASAEKLGKKIEKPGKIAKMSLQSLLPKEPINAGIFETYAGYITASDLNGQVTFPRQHEEPFFYLLITPAIQPVFMFRKTISHWETLPEAPAAFYKIERKVIVKEKPEKIKAYYWETTELPLPTDHRIPMETIVIFAKPKHFYLSSLEGIVPTNDNTNLILPPLYIAKQALTLNETLFVLSIRQFFSGITKQFKAEPMRLLSQIERMRKD